MPYLNNNQMNKSLAQTALNNAANATFNTTISVPTYSITGATGCNNYGISLNGNITGFTTNNKSTRTPPMGWASYPAKNIYGTEDEIFEAPTGPYYTTSIALNNIHSQFHFKVFVSLFPEIDYIKLGILGRDEGSSTDITNAAFLRAEDSEVFESWLSEYQERFGSREKLYLHSFPPPPARATSLSSSPVIVNDPKVAGLSTDLAIWLLSHCEGRVYAAGAYLFFESDNDLVAYRMTFA